MASSGEPADCEQLASRHVGETVAAKAAKKYKRPSQKPVCPILNNVTTAANALK